MAHTQRHDLLDILAIALSAVIGGADHWTEVVEFGQAKQQWFAGFLKLPNGIPSHDTFARVFRLINTEALEETCHQWLRSVVGRVQGIFTIDAMGCQKAIAKDIIAAGADYVLGLKTNHHHLCLSVASWFDKSLANGFVKQAHSHYLDAAGPSSHGRIETREHWVEEVPAHLKRAAAPWTSLKTVAMVRRTRQVGDKTSTEDSYYLSSLALSTCAQVLARAVRSHWSVENELHWSMDVGFLEDDCQVRKDNAPATMACGKRMALTQLKQENGKKLGIQGKRRRAGWDTQYLETVLRMGEI